MYVHACYTCKLFKLNILLVPTVNSELYNHALAHVFTVIISSSYMSINQLPKATLGKYKMRTRKRFSCSQRMYCQNLQQLRIHLRYFRSETQTQGFICDLFCLISRKYCSLCLGLLKTRHEERQAEKEM